MTTPPTVWIVDNEQWPRVCLRAELIERGQELMGELENTRIPVLLLAGAVTAHRSIAGDYPWAAVMYRPFTIGEVADRVSTLYAAERGHEAVR
jgi:hypothetical protein